MSENAISIQKRAHFNEETDMASGLIYPNSPIPKSPRIAKPTQFPSSSGQASPKFRHKSPTSRHLSPHRSVSKNKIIYNLGEINSIRKTQSTALSAFINVPWSRSSTASTPDLKIEDQNIETEGIQSENCNTGRYRRSTCYYNFRLIFVILNCIILAAALIYLSMGVVLTIYKETILIIVEYQLYAFGLILLYIEAIVLLVISMSNLFCLHRRSRKKHIGSSLLMAIFTIFLGIMQNTVQTNIQTNLKQRMVSSIELEPDVNAKAAWDYFQETWNCCGTEGRFDWCEKVNSAIYITNSTDFLGVYTCHLPISCCKKISNDTESSEDSINQQNDEMCVTSPTPWNTNQAGCLGHVRREICFMGKLFRTISFGTGIILFLSSVTAAILFVYL